MAQVLPKIWNICIEFLDLGLELESLIWFLFPEFLKILIESFELLVFLYDLFLFEFEGGLEFIIKWLQVVRDEGFAILSFKELLIDFLGLLFVWEQFNWSVGQLDLELICSFLEAK